jgi:hypothetical protein
LFKFVLDLIEHIAHLYTQCLAFFRPGYDTAIIVRKNNNRFADEVRMKYPLAGTIEVIAISQSEEFHETKIYGSV